MTQEQIDIIYDEADIKADALMVIRRSTMWRSGYIEGSISGAKLGYELAMEEMNQFAIDFGSWLTLSKEGRINQTLRKGTKELFEIYLNSKK